MQLERPSAEPVRMRSGEGAGTGQLGRRLENAWRMPPALAQPAARPSTLAQAAARPRLKLFARVVDFEGAGDIDPGQKRIISNLLKLGFKVDIDYSQVQVENACGVVACAVASRLQLPDWQTADVSFAAARATKVEGLRLLGSLARPPWGPIRALLACPPLCTSELVRMCYVLNVERFCRFNVRNRARFSVLPYDKLLRKLRSDVRSCSPCSHICICNTEHSRMQGRHWFTVAYSIEYHRSSVQY